LAGLRTDCIFITTVKRVIRITAAITPVITNTGARVESDIVTMPAQLIVTVTGVLGRRGIGMVIGHGVSTKDQRIATGLQITRVVQRGDTIQLVTSGLNRSKSGLPPAGMSVTAAMVLISGLNQ
jgi:hypothetical protein